ncbi:positive regulation of cilium movement [Tritrichomonas musculus]|uniref:Positive regulation of cilium movement n=1 Tax=Tritrichomonas musculus TaxID=1915356 RepID=A0ABR2K151_9EUKA
MFPAQYLIDVKKVKYPIVKTAIGRTKFIQVSNDPKAALIWWDGFISTDEYINLLPYQKINKIPGMDVICYKSNFFQSLQKMKNIYPSFYSFFATTFQLPYQYSEFLLENNRLQGKATWIFKPRAGCSGIGIRLIQNSLDVSRESRSAIIQRYISPYLIDGYKFDFRLYILISKVSPYTVYIYEDGLARFCSEPYTPPNCQNLDNHFSHLTNTAVNVKSGEHDNICRLASSVLQLIPNNSALWNKIKQDVALTMIALLPQIIHNINLYSLDNRESKKKFSNPPHPYLSPIDRYFHICGIDILINHRGEPFVLELNDRPSLSVTFPIEEPLKTKMIFDALKVMFTNEFGGWQKILPPPETTLTSNVLNQIQQQVLKGVKIPSSMPTIQKNQKTQKPSIPRYYNPKHSNLPPLSRTLQ